jgi:ABC-type nitrate/sulfonate/bicarbonate transport system substrate-binding protein
MRITSRRSRVVRGSLLAVAVALMPAVAAGCGSDDEGAASSGSSSASGSGGAGEMQSATLLLPYPMNLNYVAGVMAADRFFEEEGLDVKVESVDGSPVVAQQLVAGRAEFAVSGTVSVLTANSQGGELRAISSARQSATAVLSVLEDSPIQSVEDLEGKSVGIPNLSDGSVPVLTAVLGKAGLKVGEDVRLLVVGEGGPGVAAALTSDRIAAYSAGISDQPGLVNAGVKLRSIMPEEYVGLPDAVFVTTQEVLDDPEQREVAIKMARALVKGAAFAKQNPDVVVEAGCELVPDQCQDRDAAKVAVDLGIPSDNPVPGTDYAYIDPAKIEVYVDAMKQAEQLPQDVSIGDTFPDTYVDEITTGLDEVTQGAGS